MPRQRTTLRRREVLHGMKTKGREVSDRSHLLSLARSTEGMGRITTDRHASQHPLQVRLRNKQVPLALHNRKQTVIVTRDTRQIHRDDRLRPRRDSPLHGLIVHLQAVLLHIHEDQGSPHMRHHRRTRRIGISRNDHLVTRANPQQPQGHFPTRRLRTEADRFIYPYKRSHFLFQFLRTRSGGDPPRQYGVAYFRSLRLRHVRRRERHITQFHCHKQKYLVDEYFS